MGRTKKPKKQPAGTGDSGESKSTVTLPAFGLAEDILGTPAATPPAGDAAGEMSQPAASGSGPELLPSAAVNQADTGDELHLVTFRLAQEEYAVEIGRVQEIIRVGTITTVPNSPTFIQGVINLRGRVIPVLNLRKRLHLPDSPLTKHSRIMIVESGAKVLGILVDGVSQVMRIPLSSVDAPPLDDDGKPGFVSRIGRVDARLIMIMDLDRVLAKEGHRALPV